MIGTTRTRNPLALLLLCLLTLGLSACGSESGTGSQTPPVSSPGAGQALNFSGTYEVSGLTVEKASGNQREISGTVLLAQDGDNYLSTFNLKTVLPSPDGPLHTDVIGRGEGKVEGNVLRGNARTQLVVAKVPGVDPGLPFAPRTVGTRIKSTSVARLEKDGTLSIEIETEPEPGEQYPPTRTTLRGSYVPTRAPAR